ncbi:MAG: FAD-binding oxidoreductase [Clostridia bacterium]|nr:MAG: FAD-binding oxidoreductase [Clostridia bacterium]
MSLAPEVYDALEAVVGSRYITQDPVDCEAYSGSRGGHGKDLGMERVLCQPPAAVVLPGSTREVQDVVRICNRYQIPFVPVSSYWVTHCAPRVPEALLIDLKRLNSLEIDDRHMFAVVGPGVIYSQLLEEAMRRGLYTTTPGGGSQASVVANHLTCGFSPLNYRTGFAERRILGLEWVAPDGELVRMGSLAMQDDPFWGEGIGPDLRGVLRGYIGWYGGMGIVTRMAVKLIPFQPERLVPSGISPETALEFPANRIRWFNITFPTREDLVEAMYSIARNEIGAAVTKVPVFWRYIARAKSKEHFWEMWEAPGKEEEIKNSHILRVLLVGYTSEKHLEYEIRVLEDIVKDLGGQFRPTKQSDESWLKNADSVGMWWMTGGYASIEYTIDTLDCGVRGGEYLAELKTQCTPPLMPDYGDPGWFQMGELGHVGYLEFLTYFDPEDSEDNIHKVDEWYYVTGPKKDIEIGLYNGFTLQESPVYLSGPAYGPNFHLWMDRLKGAYDPRRISNPPWPADVDEVIEKVDWLERDW